MGWKRENIEKGTFGVRELAVAADAIERRLEPRLDKITTELKHLSSIAAFGDTKDSDDDKEEVLILRVTHAFANAAKVYLNVLVSGPNPEVTEIKDAVNATIKALSDFPDPKLLLHVVWPFCITGCMAAPGQRQAFRDLASASGVQKTAFGTSWRALEVMETCWAMRDDGREEWRNCDWLDAMETLGHKVLLI
jgi:hypothetical protein